MDDDGKKKAVEPWVKKERFESMDSRDHDYPILLGNDALAEKFGGSSAFPSMLISRDGRR